MYNQQKTQKNNYIPISVLQLPPKGTFIEVSTPNPDYILYYQIDKKIYIQAYRLSVQKTKLFTNLQIYEWRKQTQFPISKTYYVNIKQSNSNESNVVQLLVYNQYCPLKLSGLNDMKITQALYMLKQTVLGFQRLAHRFGLFYVNQNMIRLNEKGHCRVWIHQNFANNFPFRSQISQQNMVRSIKQILQKRCQQSILLKRLFNQLKQFKTFLSVLREVDNFAVSNKIIVPSKFSAYSSQNSKSSKLSPSKTTKNAIRTQISSSNNFRSSVVPLRKQAYSICNQQSSTSHEKVKKNQQSQIKKIKSSETLGLINNNMKKSDGETAYSRNVKQIKYYTSSKQLPSQKDNSPRQNKKWLQESTLVIEPQLFKTNRLEKKDKKDLTYSESVVNPQIEKLKPNNYNNRSFNISNETNKLQPFLNLEKTMSKNSHQYSYADEFNNLLQDSRRQLNSSALNSPKRLRKPSDDQNIQKLRTSHTQTVMKNNGWRSFTGLLEQPRQMNSSFHQGEQQNAYIRQIKLQKLQSLGKRVREMSILPQQYDELL